MVKSFSALICLLVLQINAAAQVNIINAMFNAFNVSPDMMLYANIMNNGSDQEVYLEGRLLNGAGQNVLVCTSAIFKLRGGLNNTAQAGIKVAAAQYANGNDGSYIKTMHQLPSGKFRYCLAVKPVSGVIEDNLCEEFENESSSFMFLTSPGNNDTIDNRNPILLWNHSDPFTLQHQGEMFRLLVVELKNGQSAEGGLVTNSPILVSNFLTRHDVQYPFDAPKLENGKRYGWQVQKITNNVITNKTEAGEFVIKPEARDSYNKYVMITQNTGATYMAAGNKIFFTFEESYYSKDKSLQIKITPENQAGINSLKIKEDKKLSPKVNYKETGYNRYVLDLDETGITSGYYYLAVTNEKGQVFQLKFYIQ